MRSEPGSGATGAWRSRAPGRVNLIGEHVDYMGGVVLPCAVDRFVQLRGQPGPAWELDSEVPGGLRYLQALGEELDVEPQIVKAGSTIPAGFGMSSSAALLVAAAAGLRPDLEGREAALACQRAEQTATGVRVGVMDQMAAAVARRGHALLLDCGTLEFRHIRFPAGLVIAVIDSGVRRDLADTPYNERRREAESGMPKRVRHVQSEVLRVREFAAALEAGRTEALGGLLNASHASLRDDFEVSTAVVDEIVERAQSAPGCIGARIMGGGFGGSILALLERGAEVDFATRVGRPAAICATAAGAYAKDGA